MNKDILALINFYCVYLLGLIMFFLHLSTLICKWTTELGKLRHLLESEELELFGSYFPKVLFQTVIVGEFPILFSVYIIVNEKFSYSMFISSGLFTIVWLICAGIIIKYSYYKIVSKIKTRFKYKFDKWFYNKEFFWIMCTLLYGILFNFYDQRVFLIILSMVLGEYIWMDSMKVFSILDIKTKVINLLKTTKIEFLLLLCQASIMGYFVLGWYPIRSQNDISENILSALIIEVLCLMPILDLLMWKSMNLCAENIINNRSKINDNI